jgi:hypothetical protein
MPPNQSKYYLLGLQDAIREIELESECAEYHLQGEVLFGHQYACDECKANIKNLIEGVKNNL